MGFEQAPTSLAERHATGLVRAMHNSMDVTGNSPEAALVRGVTAWGYNRLSNPLGESHSST